MIKIIINMDIWFRVVIIRTKIDMRPSTHHHRKAGKKKIILKYVFIKV